MPSLRGSRSGRRRRTKDERRNRRDRANAEQLQASDPAVSAFVGASAGSGKTKLLTDRLLRLMLTGAAPERIQCLTFTKAAAAEMAVRLQKHARPLGHARRRGAGERTARARRRADRTQTLTDGPRAVRPRARPAGRHAHRHHPRLLPVAAAPLPAGGGAVAALPAGRRPRRRGRADRGARDHAGACQRAATCVRRWRRWPGSHRPTSSAGTSRRCSAICRGCRTPSTLGEPLEDAQRRALGVTAASEAEIIAVAVNWQAERGCATRRRSCERLGAKRCAERAGRILDWLGLEAAERGEHWQRLVRGVPDQGGQAARTERVRQPRR